MRHWDWFNAEIGAAVSGTLVLKTQITSHKETYYQYVYCCPRGPCHAHYSSPPGLNRLSAFFMEVEITTVKVKISPDKSGRMSPEEDSHRTRSDPFKGKMSQIIRHFDKRGRGKLHCILIHCESSPREQRNMFCALHGDSFTFSASSASSCHFCSLSFSPGLYLCSCSLESISCLSISSSSIPHSPPHGLSSTSLDFLLTDLQRLSLLHWGPMNWRHAGYAHILIHTEHIIHICRSNPQTSDRHIDS